MALLSFIYKYLCFLHMDSQTCVQRPPLGPTVVVDRWSLFSGHLCYKSSNWDHKMVDVVAIRRWSLAQVWLYSACQPVFRTPMSKNVLSHWHENGDFEARTDGLVRLITSFKRLTDPIQYLTLQVLYSDEIIDFVLQKKSDSILNGFNTVSRL